MSAASTWRLGIRFITLLVFLTCVAAYRLFLHRWFRSGFFPQQDTGLIFGQVIAGQDVSTGQMQSYMAQFAEIVSKDPAVAHCAASTGGSGKTQNNGRMFIQLKPRDERDVSADQIIRRLQPKLAAVRARGCSCRPRRMCASAAALSATQYQYMLQEADLDELDDWAPKLLDEAAAPARAARRRDRPEEVRHDADAAPSIATRPPATASRRR